MPPRLRPPALAFLGLAVALSGCFQFSSMVTVRPDGSATVRDSLGFSGPLAMAEAEDGTLLSSRADADARAHLLGDGVQVARFEATATGYVAVYDVPDVRQLHYALPDTGPDSSASETPTAVDDPEMSLTFTFEEGDPATLRAIAHKPAPGNRQPQGNAPSDLPSFPDEPDPLGEVSSLFGDARMTVVLRVEGDVTETTAAYADGSGATLLDIAFASLLEHANKLAQLGRQASSRAEMYAVLNAIEGVRVQKPGTVRIRFR